MGASNVHLSPSQEEAMFHNKELSTRAACILLTTLCASEYAPLSAFLAVLAAQDALRSRGNPVLETWPSCKHSGSNQLLFTTSQ